MNRNLFNFQRFLLLRLQSALNFANPFAFTDKILIRKVSKKIKYQPIFIVGAPRTGSTLLFQLLTNQYQFAYLNNLQSLFYKSPVTMARISTLTHKRGRHPLNSTYGYSPGLLSPSEAGKVFTRWLGKTDQGKLSKKQIDSVRKTVDALSQVPAAPFLSKNLQNSLRLKKIHQVFPKAFFIWIDREPTYTAQSLLEMRRKLYETEQAWASIKPFGYQEIKKNDPLTQVVLQIRSINNYIKTFLKETKTQNFALVQYEKLCSQPKNELNKIMAAYRKQTGVKLESTNLPIPLITNQNIQRLADKKWGKLLKTIKLFKKTRH